jgi:chromate transporter
MMPVAEHRDYGVDKRTDAAIRSAADSGGCSWVACAFAISSFYKRGHSCSEGHVVLPLLQTSIVPNGLITNDAVQRAMAAYQRCCGDVLAAPLYAPV